MTPHRTRLLAAGAGAAWLLLTSLLATPAHAHGSMTSPVSRQAACGPQPGEYAGTPACRHLSAQPFGDWDNVRAANIAGRDRELIPDGELCSAGIEEYHGLDTPSADWPATELSPGADFTFIYRATIPHEGTFRLYVTNDAYDPTQPLTWSDLEVEPFLTATDPTVQDGAYRIRGTLPDGKDGRHLIYTVWQNTDTPDTYYSCSDVVFTSQGGASGEDGEDGEAAPEASATPGASAQGPVADPDTEPATALGGTGGVLPLTGAALVLVIFVVAVAALRYRRS